MSRTRTYFLKSIKYLIKYIMLLQWGWWMRGEYYGRWLGDALSCRMVVGDMTQSYTFYMFVEY